MEAAFFDRTARGRLIVTGHDNRDLIHRLCTNDILGLKAGQGRPACFLTGKGRLIDWAVILHRGDDLLLLSGNPERLAGHIQQFTISEDVTVRNYMAVELVVCGPAAAGILGVSLEPWHHCRTKMGEMQVLVARVEPWLGDGYVILAPDAVALRRTLAIHAHMLQGEEIEEARIRSGIPSFPAEINEEHNPWEAGLGGSIALHKGCYVGQEVVARLHTYEKIQHHLAQVRLDEPLPAGTRLTRGGEDVGVVTSAAGTAALAFLRPQDAEPGVRLDRAVVAALPFAWRPD